LTDEKHTFAGPKSEILSMSVLLSWISVNWIEVAAALVSVTYVILTIKQIIWLWLFGILSSILYAVVYEHSGFYAGMALQAYYAIISIYGWFHWSAKSKEPSGSEGLPVIRANYRLLIIMVGLWIILWLVIGYVLDEYTNSTLPYWDALTASGGIVATWMLARKILEQWLFWIVIDTISIGLYVWQELYATSILFIVYIFMAIVGYRQWSKAWLKAA
jgi:nicotinamide mononucleotide transporter